VRTGQRRCTHQRVIVQVVHIRGHTVCLLLDGRLGCAWRTEEPRSSVPRRHEGWACLGEGAGNAQRLQERQAKRRVHGGRVVVEVRAEV
jgi:hypothetical protein